MRLNHIILLSSIIILPSNNSWACWPTTSSNWNPPENQLNNPPQGKAALKGIIEDTIKSSLGFHLVIKITKNFQSEYHIGDIVTVHYTDCNFRNHWKLGDEINIIATPISKNELSVLPIKN